MLGAGAGATLKMGAPRSALNDLATEGMDTNYADGGGFYSFASVTLTVKSNGQLTVAIYNTVTTHTFNWHPSAPATGLGNQYSVRFTKSNDNSFGEATVSPSTGWLLLTADRTVEVSINDTNVDFTDQAVCNYTIEIAAFGGFPILETHTVTLDANSL